MEDKLSRLSNLNHKSSDSSKPMCFCGNTPEFILEAQKLIKEKNLYPDIVESDKSIHLRRLFLVSILTSIFSFCIAFE